ncbi:sterol O-acyltransferase [Coprinopsis sp. MPI-PUGE-AT-0042]|nr:sterol O-acyltransferase [Coprinopsis sp. MPI-PUGE-AT-0042]
MTRTPSGGFETSAGTVYVSKPYKSKESKKLRALVTFTPRHSAFDINNVASGANEFRGFFTLFWISTFIFTVRTYIRSIETSGEPLSLAFAAMFSQDALGLALSDAALVLSTGICVPYAIALKKGWIQYYWIGVALQHLIQTSILTATVVWTFNRQWPWVQSGYLTLHALVMVMKMHSYMNINGYLSWVYGRSELILDELKRRVNNEYPGEERGEAWSKAIAAAQLASKEVRDDSSEAESIGQQTPDSTSTPLPPANTAEDSVTTYVEASTVSELRKRLNAVTETQTISNGVPVKGQQNGHPLRKVYTDKDVDNASKSAVPPHMAEAASSSSNSALIVAANPPPEPHPLVHHPNRHIASLAEEYSDALQELRSRGPKDHTQWPNNIGWKDFAVYQLIPSLVYELEYPRTDRIRPLYVFEKTVATFGTFALLYTVTDRFILPYTPTADQSFFRSLLDLSLPFMLAYLLLFYIIFECICNGFAELSYFADRQFYEDWWNSTSWDEFSRKWNKPVHTFLLRHVYAPVALGNKSSRARAMFFTFLLSAAAHELVMVIVTHKIRMYLFMLQLIQIPMIAIGRIPAIKRNKLMGNIVFWLGLYAGFPLLCVAYVAH